MPDPIRFPPDLFRITLFLWVPPDV